MLAGVALAGTMERGQGEIFEVSQGIPGPADPPGGLSAVPVPVLVFSHSALMGIAFAHSLGSLFWIKHSTNKWINHSENRVIYLQALQVFSIFLPTFPSTQARVPSVCTDVK